MDRCEAARHGWTSLSTEAAMHDFPSRIVVMGVTASGKSSVGVRLADRLDLPFKDGDDLHPQSNIDKMSRGEPLDDADRAPWLDAVGKALGESDGLVVACSALKRAYRERILGHAPDTVFVVLHAARHVLQERIDGRTDHFMPPDLLDSQLMTLEMPGGDEPAVTVGVQVSLESVVQRAIARLGALSPA